MEHVEVISATEAARSFSDLLHRVHYQHQTFIIKKGSRIMARIAPEENKMPSGLKVADLFALLAKEPSLTEEEYDEQMRLLEEQRRNPAQFRAWDE